MYRLVIIEDELVVRRNIIKKIEWGKYGFEVVGQAENGREGVEIIEALRPDVVITDIEMPFMDGLELSAILREKYPIIKIILLTGFDEFKYAQKAIELNVIEYILKPVSADNMIKVLNKVKMLIDKEISEKEDIEALKEHYLESFPVMKANFLNSLIATKQSREEVLKKALTFKIDFRGSMFTASAISLDKNSIGRTNFNEEDYELVKFAVLNTTEEISSKYSGVNVFYNENHVGVIYSFNNNNKSFILGETFRLLEEVRQNIEKYMKITVTIGIGNICTAIENIHESYKSALAALDYRFVIGNNKLIYIEDLEPKSHKRITFDENKERMLLTNIKVSTEDEINNTINKIFDEIVEVKASFSDYQVYILELLASVVKVTKDLNVDINTIFGQNYNLFNEIFKFNTIDDVKGWFKSICVRLMNSISARRVNSCRIHVERAKEYIKANYKNSELSINDVSSYLHISPSYFGAVFKEETGENFVNFLLKVRMERARDLICTTNLKNFQIAENVGYADQHYFSYCFKKYFNISPNEFRNSLNKE